MLEIISARSALAKKYGLKKGDVILAFDGFDVEDELDYIFYDSKSSFTMTVTSKGVKREINVEKKEYESFYLNFKRSCDIKTCHNHCIFCFVDQMKKGLRESLYVKDDDYSMSFCCGNFVTLTNVDEKQIERIIRLNLSPLYVSVHTMNEKLRCELLGNRFAGKITRQLKALAQANISMHCQAVIVPEKNDGKELEYTARELFKLYPAVRDLAVVPTGLTSFREGLTPIPDFTKEQAEQILSLCDKLNEEFKVNFVLPADEYFVRSGTAFKPASFYGDFSQIENGIGMTSKFVAEFDEAIYSTKLKKPRRVAVITGVSAYRTIDGLCQRANVAAEGLHAFALAVENKFFGSTVTCTGLLTGGDILRQLLIYKDGFDCAIIPANTLKEFEDVFLDGMTVKQLKRGIRDKKIIINRNTQDFFENLIKG